MTQIMYEKTDTTGPNTLSGQNSFNADLRKADDAATSLSEYVIREQWKPIESTGDAIYIEFLKAALQGSATTVATRHDCVAPKMVRAAMEIADNAVEQLKIRESQKAVK